MRLIEGTTTFAGGQLKDMTPGCFRPVKSFLPNPGHSTQHRFQ
jgi:hypothetical protein